jgi:cell division protein FtsW
MRVAVTTLAVCVSSLLALGLVMLYSSSMVMVDKQHSPVGARMLQMQLIWAALGAMACFVMARLDYAILRKLVWPIFLVTVVLAALVFVPPFGKRLNGAHRWIGLPGLPFTLQPSELIKIALIIAIAWYGERTQRKMHSFFRGIMVPGLIIGSALALVFIEPDRGTTILMAGVTGTMLLLAGARWWHLIMIGMVAVGLLLFSFKHDSMRSGRISAWLHPEAHLSGAALQAEEAKKAIGAGGLLGVGLGNGLQKNGFVPEIQSDFIFANIGEELGLIATFSVVAAFFLIACCGFQIARQARDQFGCLLAVGITFLISYQALINMGVVTSLLPNKGLALPFISAGGSSLCALLAGVGILISVARQADPLKKVSSDFAPEANPFSAKPT